MTISRIKDYEANRIWKERTKVNGEVAALYKLKRAIADKIKIKQAVATELGHQAKAQMGGYHISDHSILRFMEHEKLVNVDEIINLMELNSLLADDECRQDFSIVRGKYQYIFKDRTLLTVKPAPKELQNTN